MRRSPFTYLRGARVRDVLALADDLSPMEAEQVRAQLGDDAARPDRIKGMLLHAAAVSRTYVALIDRKLAGICFVRDLPDRREMAFTKTRYLTERRKITFARSVGALLRDLARLEAACGRDRLPMLMHTPEGDDASRDWFVSAGCLPVPGGLLCPPHQPHTKGTPSPWESPRQ